MNITPRRFVYVLESVSFPERHYVGLAADVSERLNRHNKRLTLHTAKLAPWRVTVSIEFSEERLAVSFERYLKTGSGRAFAKRHFR